MRSNLPTSATSVCTSPTDALFPPTLPRNPHVPRANTWRSTNRRHNPGTGRSRRRCRSYTNFQCRRPCIAVDWVSWWFFGRREGMWAPMGGRGYGRTSGPHRRVALQDRGREFLEETRGLKGDRGREGIGLWTRRQGVAWMARRIRRWPTRR